MTNECVFCQIVAGAAPASFVHRDDLVAAFMDIQPVAPGHLLVVPNDHVAKMQDVPDEVAERVFAVGRRLARALGRAGLRAEGVDMFVADGEAAGQDVFHAHLHVIPRFADDGFVIDAAAWRAPPPGRDELDRWAAQIKSAAEGRGSEA